MISVFIGSCSKTTETHLGDAWWAWDCCHLSNMTSVGFGDLSSGWPLGFWNDLVSKNAAIYLSFGSAYVYEPLTFSFSLSIYKGLIQILYIKMHYLKMNASRIWSVVNITTAVVHLQINTKIQLTRRIPVLLTDVASFSRKCTSKQLQGRDIGVTRVERTDSVLVQGEALWRRSHALLQQQEEERRRRSPVLHMDQHTKECGHHLWKLWRWVFRLFTKDENIDLELDSAQTEDKIIINMSCEYYIKARGLIILCNSNLTCIWVPVILNPDRIFFFLGNKSHLLNLKQNLW